MEDSAIRQGIRDFARRYLAISADGTPPTGGYFAIRGRRRGGREAAVRDPVQWNHDPDPAKVIEEVVERAMDAALECEHVWVCPYRTNGTNPMKRHHIDGEADAELALTDEESPKGPHAAMEALARVAIAQQRENADLRREAREALEEVRILDRERGVLMYHTLASQNARGSELATKAIEVGLPGFMEGLPSIVESLARVGIAWAGRPVGPPPAAPSGAVPEEVGAAVGWYVARILADAAALQARLVAAVVKDPAVQTDETVNRELLKLRDLVQRLGPLVGLKVEPINPEPT